MGKVVDIGANIPHFCIIGPLDEPHVVPVSTLKRMAASDIKLINDGQEIEDGNMIRGIIREWLEMKGVDMKCKET